MKFFPLLPSNIVIKKDIPYNTTVGRIYCLRAREAIGEVATYDKKEIATGVQKWWLKNIIYLIFIGAILFLASGKPSWLMAWVYLASVVVVLIVNAIMLDPKLLLERSGLQTGTKKWDVVLASLVAVWGPLFVFLVAGLDNRLGWSKLNWLTLEFGAIVFFVLGSLMTTRAMVSNEFFSATVRIQTERNHTVVTKGPYQYVRHPGYAGAIIAMLMTPLALGSWVALIPSIMVACGYVVRTCLEDRVLREELEGYQHYASEVRYRLLPWVW